MLLEQGEEILVEHKRMAEAVVSFVQTVQGNYEDDVPFNGDMAN